MASKKRKSRDGSDGGDGVGDVDRGDGACVAGPRAAAARDRLPGPGGELSRKEYDALLEPLELELNNLARWLQKTGRRLAVVFEGRDTAGKGGAIAAIAAKLSPRQCHVVALPKPSERERTQWVFQRHIAHLPAAGEIVLFDRSWYNRAGVERVMGYASDEQARAFLTQAPAFERMLVDDGTIVLKYWLMVDQAEQEKRFAERVEDPLKRWKISPIDLESRTRYDAYTTARDEMLAATHTSWAPWTLVDFNDQKRGRIALIRHLLDSVPDTRVDPEPLVLPPLAGKPGRDVAPAGFVPI